MAQRVDWIESRGLVSWIKTKENPHHGAVQLTFSEHDRRQNRRQKENIHTLH